MTNQQKNDLIRHVTSFTVLGTVFTILVLSFPGLVDLVLGWFFVMLIPFMILSALGIINISSVVAFTTLRSADFKRFFEEKKEAAAA